MAGSRHLYVHLPFCSHRCGYCDFVTAVGQTAEHGPYVDAVIAELDRERHHLAPELDTVFVGGGTPTYTEPAALARLLAALPSARETTVEANPETVTPALARSLRKAGVTRVSLGAQSFQPRLLAVLDRAAGPDDVRQAVHTLCDACIDNVSLDLVYGIPGQEPADLEADLVEALALRPDHLSCYELEAKPGTRFTHRWGEELGRQAEAMEGYFEQVVDRLTGAGYRWYETASFCLDGSPDGVDLRAQHNLGYWRGRTYLGIGVGAVSTIDGGASVGSGEGANVVPPGSSDGPAVRRRNLPSVARYVSALREGVEPPRELEELDGRTRRVERLMLGLRLDEWLSLDGLGDVVDRASLRRLVGLGLIELRPTEASPDGQPASQPTAGDRATGEAIRLTRRGRFLGSAVTAELLDT